MELIRGMIVTSVNATVEILVPSHKARQPGRTRLEAAGKVLAEIGLEVEGANRVQIKPVEGDRSLMVWYQFDEGSDRVSRIFGMLPDD